MNENETICFCFNMQMGAVGDFRSEFIRRSHPTRLQIIQLSFLIAVLVIFPFLSKETVSLTCRLAESQCMQLALEKRQMDMGEKHVLCYGLQMARSEGVNSMYQLN